MEIKNEDLLGNRVFVENYLFFAYIKELILTFLKGEGGKGLLGSKSFFRIERKEF